MKSQMIVRFLIVLTLCLSFSCSRKGGDYDVKITTGYSENIDPFSGVHEAVNMALKGLKSKQIKGVVFYANYKDHPIEIQIGQIIAAALPAEVPSIGVRSIPHTDKGTLWEHSIALMVMSGKDVNCRVTFLPLDDNRLKMGKTIGEEYKNMQDLALLLTLAEPGLSFAPNHISVEDFLAGIYQSLGDNVMVFGGNGEPNFDTGQSIQWINGKVSEKSVVTMGIAGPVRFIGTNAHEFHMSEKVVMVTKSIGKWVLKFDDRPAAEVYRELSGKGKDEPITYDEKDPIGVDLGDGQLYLRMVLFEKKSGDKYSELDLKLQNYIEESKDLPTGSLRFIAEVPEGTKVRILTYEPSAKRILQSALSATRRSLNMLEPGEQPLLLLTSSCCARRSRLRELEKSADEVLQGIHPAMETRFPVFGFDAWGELGPINHKPNLSDFLDKKTHPTGVSLWYKRETTKYPLPTSQTHRVGGKDASSYYRIRQFPNHYRQHRCYQRHLDKPRWLEPVCSISAGNFAVFAPGAALRRRPQDRQGPTGL